MRILLVRFGALGDAVLVTGLIEYIKNKRADVIIDFAVAEEIAPAFSENKNLHQLITIPRKSSRSAYCKLAKSLEPYDHVFDLHGTLKATSFARNVSGNLHIINKYSLQRRLFVNFRWFKNQLNRHVVQRYADLVLPTLGLHTYTLEELRPYFATSAGDQLITERFALPADFVVIHPYASQQNKVWPHFFALCEKLHDHNITTVVVGNGETPWPAHTIDLSRQTDLPTLKRIISQARVVVTTDSGPMHIATAYRRPTIAIFGPTTKELGFWPDFKLATVMENPAITCRPCHIHGGDRCPRRHFQCMKSIAMLDVCNQVLAIL